MVSTTIPPAKQSAEHLLYQPVSPQADAVRMAWLYPAPYNIAMSSLGYLSLFAQLDQNPSVDAQRVYMDTLKAHNWKQFEMVGMSFSFELDILAILDFFQTAGIPMYSRDRNADTPLIFAGGPVIMSNPEPYADFFDFFVIGEGEEVLSEVTACFARYRDLGRIAQLEKLAAEVPGVYVPAFYDVTYDAADGPIVSIQPNRPNIPPVVNKRLIDNDNMDDWVSSSPILTANTVFENRFLVEVMRGCAHRCRFCLASYTMLPARGPSLEAIIGRIETGLKYTNNIGLLGALIANHPQFDALCDFLNNQEELNLSGSSLRVDTLTPHIAETFKRGGQKQITLAVETGSDWLKRRINKNITNAQVVEAAGIVAASGLKGLKLYGMVGLPDEEEEDVVAMVDLVTAIKKAHPRLRLTLTVSSFVPKGGTPFQWHPKLDNKTVQTRQQLLKKSLLNVAAVRPTSPKWDYIQTLLARGDRRLAPLIVRYHQLGASWGALNRAVKELKADGKNHFPELDWVVCRERPQDEILPWEHIYLGVEKKILFKEGLIPVGLMR